MLVKIVKDMSQIDRAASGNGATEMEKYVLMVGCVLLAEKGFIHTCHILQILNFARTAALI